MCTLMGYITIGLSSWQLKYIEWFCSVLHVESQGLIQGGGVDGVASHPPWIF